MIMTSFTTCGIVSDDQEMNIKSLHSSLKHLLETGGVPEEVIGDNDKVDSTGESVTRPACLAVTTGLRRR